MNEPAERFSDRVNEYVLYRPSYPLDVVRTLEQEADVRPDATRVLDVGCGTGISAELLLREGYRVTGVEPNAPMRAAAEQLEDVYQRFCIVEGRAEEVALPDSSFDLVVAAQAFHWFDRMAAREEMKRLLVHRGVVALIWNERRTDSSPFLRAYEAILARFGTDYARVVGRYPADDSISAFFGPGGCRRRVFSSRQEFDLEGLLGRAMSSSYVPRRGHPGHDDIVRALTDAYARHAHDGRVAFEYDTKLYFGRFSD